MASKWKKVVEGLMEAAPADLDYQAVVDAMKAKITENTTHTPESLGKLLGASKKELERIEALRYDEQIRTTALEQMLADSWDSDETGWGMYGASPDTLRLPDGARVEAKAEPVFKVTDKEAFRLWCIENGLEKSLQLWPATMSSISGQRLLAEHPLPTGVEATFQKKVKYVKPRAASE